MVPPDHANSTMAKYLGLCRSGTRSQKMTWLRVMMPPPPTPWMLLPTSMTATVVAAVQTVEPAVNRVIDRRSSRRRPK